MRPPVDEGRLRELARSLGRVAGSPTRIYLTGGATAVIEGWRGSTMDVDLRFEPEVDELLRELPALKERLARVVSLPGDRSAGVRSQSGGCARLSHWGGERQDSVDLLV